MCDTLCVRTRDGMLFAKNSDRHPDEAQVIEWHDARAPAAEMRTQYLTIPDEGAHAFLGSRPTWLWGVEHGVNEHRVAIGNEKIWTVDRPKDLPPALLGMDLVRLGLERSRSAEDALGVITTLLERHGQGGSGEPHRDEPYFSSFLVADPTSGFVIETSNRTWAARPVGDGDAISNRIGLGTDWTRASANVAPHSDFDAYRLPGMPTAVADHRLAVTRATVARADAATPRALADTLRSHGPRRDAGELPGEVADDFSGFTVCMHRPESHAQTTAAMIAELRSGAPLRSWMCLGNPCVGVFVPCFPPAVPPELADAGQWRRFAALRDRVEATPELLNSVRTVLAGVEAELWDAADAAFASGARSELDACARAAFGPVDAALRRLGV